ncbi:hypothetical protein AAFF_G00146360 [Aldrovandia affinis]|uniref:Uncharacterized protein n=1 Tax=Aldrovandia affinis TaxID=143900 RepID=A0AAD7RQ32_9TELE|nr:hypothetical protein AAFF_G00146360 [Aldrovandia affinis]
MTDETPGAPGAASSGRERRTDEALQVREPRPSVRVRAQTRALLRGPSGRVNEARARDRWFIAERGKRARDYRHDVVRYAVGPERDTREAVQRPRVDQCTGAKVLTRYVRQIETTR